MNLKCRYRKESKAHQKGKIKIESIVQNRGISERVHTPWPACHCHSGYFISSRVFASHQRQVESPKRIIKENTSVLPSLTTSQDQMRCVILRLSYTSCDLCFFFFKVCAYCCCWQRIHPPPISVLRLYTSHRNPDDVAATRPEETVSPCRAEGHNPNEARRKTILANLPLRHRPLLHRHHSCSSC